MTSESFAALSAGERLRQLRTEHGLTQQSLATRAGITRRTVRRIEADQVTPLRNTATMLAAVLGCLPADLRGGR